MGYGVGGVAEWHASGLEPPRPLLLLLRGGGVTLPEKIKAPMKMGFIWYIFEDEKCQSLFVLCFSFRLRFFRLGYQKVSRLPTSNEIYPIIRKTYFCVILSKRDRIFSKIRKETKKPIGEFQHPVDSFSLPPPPASSSETQDVPSFLFPLSQFVLSCGRRKLELYTRRNIFSRR